MTESLRKKHGECVLCKRITRLSFHHLIPRKMHRRQRFRKTCTREELARGINVCDQCHRGIHRLHDEMTLAKQLNSEEALRCDPAIRKHYLWVRQQKQV